MTQRRRNAWNWAVLVVTVVGLWALAVTLVVLLAANEGVLMLAPTATTAQLLEVLERTGAACVRVASLPPEARRRGGEKGTASPEQAGTLSAWLFVKAATQLVERGVLPADWLDEVLS